MLKRRVALGLSLVFVATAALAQSSISPQRGGTPEEQKACSRDVARHCKAVMNADDFTVLGCLQQNRAKLAPACLKVLTDHGV